MTNSSTKLTVNVLIYVLFFGNFYPLNENVNSNIEACIGVLGIQDICHFTSRDIDYFPFYWDTMFIFEDTAIFSPKDTKNRVKYQ